MFFHQPFQDIPSWFPSQKSQILGEIQNQDHCVVPMYISFDASTQNQPASSHSVNNIKGSSGSGSGSGSGSKSTQALGSIFHHQKAIFAKPTKSPHQESDSNAL